MSEKDFFEEIIDEGKDPNQEEEDGGVDTTSETDEKEEEETETTETTTDEGSTEEETEDKEETETTEEEPDLEENDEDIEDPQLILQRYKTLQGMYKSQKQRLEELAKKLEEPEENEPPEQPEKTEQQTTQQEPEPSNMDMGWVSVAIKENEKVAELVEELPELATLVEESLKSVMEKYTIAVSQAMQVMAQQIEEKVAPIEQTIGKTLKEQNEARIAEVHSDYETHLKSEELRDWINSKPSRIKAAYEDIIKDGNADEVIELLNDYKQETKIASSEEPRIKKKTPKAVSTKSKSPTMGKPIDMNDFEQAFEEAVREE